MGGCLLKEPPSRTDNPTTMSTSSKSLFNPEQSIEDYGSALVTKRTPKKPTFSEVSLPDSVATIEDCLREQEIERDQWQAQHKNSSSVILKLGKKKNRESIQKDHTSSVTKVSSVISQLQQSEAFEGTVKNEQNHTRITVRNDIGNIQFLLPKTRAGPLVVPYLIYDRYSP